MAVANGQDAGLAWESLTRGGLAQAERGDNLEGTESYCGQNTLVMVRLLEKLKGVYPVTSIIKSSGDSGEDNPP